MSRAKMTASAALLALLCGSATAHAEAMQQITLVGKAVYRGKAKVPAANMPVKLRFKIKGKFLAKVYTARTDAQGNYTLSFKWPKYKRLSGYFYLKIHQTERVGTVNIDPRRDNKLWIHRGMRLKKLARYARPFKLKIKPPAGGGGGTTAPPDASGGAAPAQLGAPWKVKKAGPGTFVVEPKYKTGTTLLLKRSGSRRKLGFVSVTARLPKKITIKSKWNNTVYVDLSARIRKQQLKRVKKNPYGFAACPIRIYFLDAAKKPVGAWGLTKGAVDRKERKLKLTKKITSNGFNNKQVKLVRPAVYIIVSAEGHDFEVEIASLRLQGYLDNSKKKKWVRIAFKGKAFKIK